MVRSEGIYKKRANKSKMELAAIMTETKEGLERGGRILKKVELSGRNKDVRNGT